MIIAIFILSVLLILSTASNIIQAKNHRTTRDYNERLFLLTSVQKQLELLIIARNKEAGRVTAEEYERLRMLVASEKEELIEDMPAVQETWHKLKIGR